jgi:hypothetical protein
VGLSDIFSPFNERGCRQTSRRLCSTCCRLWIYRQLKINGPDLPNALADHKFYAKRLKMGWNGMLPGEVFSMMRDTRDKIKLKEGFDILEVMRRHAKIAT